ncbi:hypothetical protein FRC06_008837 [Ceratobasidium sp. 370]|nr:hypothetical protein FRC06_008837 [Ceratobasidium sp. 370]
MYLINSSIRDRPVSEDAGTHGTTQSTHRAKILDVHPDDFFYEDYVRLINRTAKPVDEVPVGNGVVPM